MRVVLDGEAAIRERVQQPMRSALGNVEAAGDLADRHTRGLIGDQLDDIDDTVDEISQGHLHLRSERCSIIFARPAVNPRFCWGSRVVCAVGIDKFDGLMEHRSNMGMSSRKRDAEGARKRVASRAAPLIWFAPALALLLLVTLYPTAVVVWLSFNRTRFYDVVGWTGLGSYVAVLTSQAFWDLTVN